MNLPHVFDSIKILAKYGRHKKTGWMLRDLSYAQITNHLHAETSELYYDLSDDKDEALYELADVLCIAYHIAVRRGWTLSQLAEAMQHKLDLRFETVYDDNFPPTGV